jgi:anti-sigma factor ChrR (cupin superfamily)
VPNSGTKKELAALYALGTLDPSEKQEAEELLLAEDSEFLREYEAYGQMMSDLALLAPVAGKKPPLRDRVMARILTPPPSAPLPKGLAALVSTGDLPWKSGTLPGVSSKRLFQDAEGNVTWLVKLEPGATYPRHRHTAYEHCLVLEGEVQFDEYTLRAGDYEVAQPDTDHSSFHSPNGAVLFIIANKHDEIFH